jgi:hypothetical protein
MAIRSEEKLTELMEWQVLCSFIESKGKLLCLFIDIEGICIHLLSCSGQK